MINEMPQYPIVRRQRRRGQRRRGQRRRRQRQRRQNSPPVPEERGCLTESILAIIAITIVLLIFCFVVIKAFGLESEVYYFFLKVEGSPYFLMTRFAIIELCTLSFVSCLHCMASIQFSRPHQQWQFIYCGLFNYYGTPHQIILAMGTANQLIVVWKAFFFANRIVKSYTIMPCILAIGVDSFIPRLLIWLCPLTCFSISKHIVKLEWVMFFWAVCVPAWLQKYWLNKSLRTSKCLRVCRNLIDRATDYILVKLIAATRWTERMLLMLRHDDDDETMNVVPFFPYWDRFLIILIELIRWIERMLFMLRHGTMNAEPMNNLQV
ncbi:uncharacterized protein LOC136024625 [Artemia franciscana]|uniref:uncharacterized protein LOC136024625 n=1 Tax=Artemia franciscana TaxID=6661 RepID=UPI0032D9F3C0